MADRWTLQEDKILLDYVADGVEVSKLDELLPNRSMHAITSKANDELNYGVKTINGIKRFKKDRRQNVIVGKPRAARTVQEPTILSDCLDNKPNNILANLPLVQAKKSNTYDEIFSANRKAMKFIVANNLNATSEDVKYLTDLIIRSQPA